MPAFDHYGPRRNATVRQARVKAPFHVPIPHTGTCQTGRPAGIVTAGLFLFRSSQLSAMPSMPDAQPTIVSQAMSVDRDGISRMVFVLAKSV
jgi:hypothetical protein